MSPLLLLLLALCGGASGAQTFYVSSSRGSDDNDGLSPASPWRTLERAAAAAAPRLGPGSSLLLRQGDAWSVGTADFLTGMRGTAEAPVTIGSYDDGSSGPERPLISRPAGAAAGPTLTIDNSSGVVVRSLEIAGGENGVAFTFDTVGGAPAVYDSIVVSDCFFRAIHGLHYDPASGDWWGSAVALAAAHWGVTVTGVVLSHNLVNDSDVFYANSVPYAGWTRAIVSGLAIDANTITRAWFNSLFLDTTSRTTVTRNVFLRDVPGALFRAGTTDIIMGTLDDSCSLSGNEIGWRGEYEPGGPDGCAVDFETNATGVLFDDNYVHRSYGAGVMVFGHADGSNTALRLTNNIMLYNGCNQTAADHGGIAFMRLGSSGTITGNVLATCAGTPLFMQAVPGDRGGGWWRRRWRGGGGGGEPHKRRYIRATGPKPVTHVIVIGERMYTSLHIVRQAHTHKNVDAFTYTQLRARPHYNFASPAMALDSK